jgi:subtilase family serine protease
LVFAESLEVRRLLSAVADPVAYPVDSVVGGGTANPQGSFPAGHATQQGFNVTQIKDAYGINNISFDGTAGNGSGQTIAIVAYSDNPEFVNTGSPDFDTSDLHLFDVAMGLPDPPSFIKVTDTGGTDYTTPDPSWANEIALDVEWSHAIAPAANIILVESPSTNLFDLIEGAGVYARNQSSVSVITMSFAVNEFIGENAYDSFLTTPTGHEGITFVAASGDGGDPGGYPGFSPNVVSVGATSLTLSGNAYASETGHNTSGGGISQYEEKPKYQYAVTQSSTWRTEPDVSFDGDPNTGVSVYDSYNGGASTPWYKVGGTSFSSPVWAAMIAIADQGRAKLGLGTLDGPSQTLPRLYALNSADFHDITSGATDGPTVVSAAPGYDLVTGLGTPVANLLVPDLAGGNTVTGTIFKDNNSNGQLDSGDVGLSGFTSFVDLYGNATFEGGDFQATSGSDGTYAFSDLPGGTFRFAHTTPSGWTLTTSSAESTLTLGFGQSLTGQDIGYKPSGQAAQLVFIQQPSTVIINNDITPAITVAVEDGNGNLITTDNSAVTLALSDGTTLDGAVTANASNGIATFSTLSVATAGTYTITATDGTLFSATSNSFTVNNPPPVVSSTLVIGEQPISGVTGIPLTPSVTVFLEDSSGGIVSTDDSAVTLALAAGSTTNTPTGTLTVNAVNGIATFSDIVFTSGGTASLTATDGSLTPVTTNSFTVTDKPVELGFAQQPLSTTVGKVLSPVVVDVEDYAGNPVPGDTSTVSLTVTGGTAALGGAVSVAAVSGVATFSNLTLSSAGTYTLTATDGSLISALSSSFTITVPGTVVPTPVRNTLPPSLIAGSAVRSVVTVKETASTTTSGNVTTDIYAVATDGTTTLLAGMTKKLTLKAGKTIAVSVPIRLLPTSLDGTYSIRATIVDPLGNPSSTPSLGTITLAAANVSLSVAFAKLTLANGSAVLGGSRTRTAAVLRITNSGNIASTGLTTIGIYASPDGLMSDATPIATITRKLSIKPNKPLSVTVPLGTIPNLNGTYTILAQVTGPSSPATSISSNSTVKIAPAFVQLTATLSAPTPTTAAAGKPVTLVVTLLNQGNIASTGPATITYGLTADGVTFLPGSTSIIKSLRILPGKSVAVKLKLLVDSSLPAGTFSPLVQFSQGSQSLNEVGSTGVTVG